MSRSALLAALTMSCRSEPTPIARDPVVTKTTDDAANVEDVSDAADADHHVAPAAPIYGLAPPPHSVTK
jgi:hypothetical protein